MLNTDSSKLFRRFKLYGFGVALGLVLSYGFFHDRYPTWLPGSVIMEELNARALIYSDLATCQMGCRNISKENIEDLLSNGEVIFSESEVHGEPCPTYAVEGETSEGRSLRIHLTKCDSTSEVVGAIIIEEVRDCQCE